MGQHIKGLEGEIEELDRLLRKKFEENQNLTDRIHE